MGVNYLKSDFTAGELTPELHARVDIDKYIKGVSSAKNMIIMPYGGLRRRPGLAKTIHLTSEARIEPFVFNTEQQYLIVLRPLIIDIYKSGILQSTEITTYTLEELSEIDIIQSADTMIFAHQNHAPKQLQRQGSDTSWAFTTISFESVPYYNFGAVIVEKYINSGSAQTVTVAVNEIVLNNDENSVGGASHTYYKCKVKRTDIDLSQEDFSNTTNWGEEGTQEPSWSVSRGYPKTCTFFGGRLWFAGTTSRPTSIWGSRINGFFNFDIGDSLPDQAIQDILDSDQYNIIENIFAGRSLQVFTSGGEFVNKADFITPEDSDWKRQTGYGSSNITPIMIDGATMFIDASGRNVREFLFSYEEDGYISKNATILSSHLITRAVSMASIQGTTEDVGDYVYVINEDGKVAVLNTNRLENIKGWTHFETDGEFLDVCVVGKIVYFIVKRNGEIFIEKLKEGTFTDHHVVIDGVAPTTYEVTRVFDDVVHNGDSVVFTDYSTGTAISSITTDFSSVFANTQFKVVADFSIMADSTYVGTDKDNGFAINRDAYRIEVGLNFETKVISLPVSTDTNSGNTLHRRKRVVKVDINVLKSLGVYARDIYVPDRQFPVTLDATPIPFTGFREMYLLGYNRITQIEISQRQPLPFTLRAIGFEIAY